MSRLYADENVPLPVITELRKLGHAVLTTVETEQANLRVPDICLFLKFRDKRNVHGCIR